MVDGSDSFIHLCYTSKLYHLRYLYPLWITVRKKIVRSIVNRIGNKKLKFERKEKSMKRKLSDASVSAVNETEQENVSEDD